MMICTHPLDTYTMIEKQVPNKCDEQRCICDCDNTFLSNMVMKAFINNVPLQTQVACDSAVQRTVIMAFCAIKRDQSHRDSVDTSSLDRQLVG